jgi:hypothetical protein
VPAGQASREQARGAGIRALQEPSAPWGRTVAATLLASRNDGCRFCLQSKFHSNYFSNFKSFYAEIILISFIEFFSVSFQETLWTASQDGMVVSMKDTFSVTFS